MKRVLKITFIFLCLSLLFGINSVKAADVDVVTQTINPSKSYSTLQVRYLQKELNNVIGTQIDTTGILGPQTKTAIRTFQQAYGLTVDGIVGPATRAKLNEAYKADKLIVSANTVNIRDKAGTSGSNILGKAKKGDILTVYGSTTVSGKVWYKIWYKSGFAYIISDYVKTNFVEIDITSQTIRMYINKKLKIDTPITTGRLEGITKTTKGYFPIVNMYQDKYTENKKVYWIGFDAYVGLGIHDSPWRGNYQNFVYYGGKIYKNLDPNYSAGDPQTGSHGCVNVPRPKMKTIFETIKPLYDANANSVVVYSH